MINLTSVQNGENQYLVYDLMANPHKTDNDTVLMINNNYARGLGLAKISFEDTNGEKQKIFFDVSGMTPVSDFLSREITQEAFRYIILLFAETIRNFEKYMIDIHQVVFDTDYVFINMDEQRVFFLCMPFTDSGISADDGIFEFFRSICSRAFSNVVGSGHADYTGIVSDMLRLKSSFSIEKLISTLDPEAIQRKSPVQNQPEEAAEQKESVSSADAAAFTGSSPEAAPLKKKDEPSGNNHAVVEIHASADISAESMKKASIIYLKTNMKISLETPVVRVGRSSRDVEVRLPDSIHVGRHHAEFRRRGTEYVLVDMNSSNHTLLNGKMIDPEKEYKIKNGDSIVFADEKFEYRTEI